MHSEDELAFVLGHEIEHVDHYHAVERLQIEAQLHKLDLEVLADLAGIPLALWQAGYTKDQEFEADSEGLLLVASPVIRRAAPSTCSPALSNSIANIVIHADTPTGEFSQLAIEGLMGYFRSHPRPPQRLARVEALIIRNTFRQTSRSHRCKQGTAIYPRYQP